MLAAVFCVFLITTYAVGFNLLCSYNLQSSFAAYSFYDTKTTPIIVGAVLAGLTAYCLLGGGKRIVRLTSILVPFMGIAYIGISLLVILMNAAWAMADITMGGMTLINLPCCMLLGKVAINALKDYEAQKKDGKNPVFLWKEHRSFG